MFGNVCSRRVIGRSLEVKGRDIRAMRVGGKFVCPDECGESVSRDGKFISGLR